MVNFNLTLTEFRELPHLEKHEYTEKLMGNRIILPYKEALNVFKFILFSYEKINRAFENFKVFKNIEYNQIPPGIHVLTSAYLDKFTGKLFFILKEDFGNLSHYVFDILSGELINFANNKKFNEDLDPPYPQNISLYFRYNENATLEENWFKPINHDINDMNSEEAFENFENIEYDPKAQYNLIIQYFKHIEDPDYDPTNIFEVNISIKNMLVSRFNPAHTLIDSKDIGKSINIKRAFSQ